MYAGCCATATAEGRTAIWTNDENGAQYKKGEMERPRISLI